MIMEKTMPVEGKFELMTLPYAPQALEPVISANTLGFHHGKHLLTYVNNLLICQRKQKELLSPWRSKPKEKQISG